MGGNELVTLLPSNPGVSVHGYLKNVTRKLSNNTVNATVNVVF
jgi:hypothetical protein